MSYQRTWADDAGLRQRMRAIAQEPPRFGYRRLHVLLKREGYVINHKKLFRLYREEKLRCVAVAAASGRSGPGADDRSDGAERPLVARLRIGSAHRWSPLPYPHRGRRLHRRVPDAGGRHLALGHSGGAELDRLMIEHGKPKMMVSDNGSELTTNATMT